MNIPQERASERMSEKIVAEQVADFLVPLIKEDFSKVFKAFASGAHPSESRAAESGYLFPAVKVEIVKVLEFGIRGHLHLGVNFVFFYCSR